jgi:hypothetical protein
MRKAMNRVILLMVVIGVCIGCSGSQGSAPDYEIVSEQEKNVSNLKTKTINVSTEATEEQKLRQIAREIKSENTGYDALSIQFHRDTQGKGSAQDTGTAIVVNNEGAADEILPDVLFTDADRQKILNKNDGILVITLAEMKQAEREMKEAEREMKDVQKGLEQDLQEMEEDIPKLPKP